MADRDTTEFLTAFAIGAVLGVGATLLLRPQPPTGRERVARELRDYRKRAGKGAKRARQGFERGLGAARERGGEVLSGGADVMESIRDEVADLVASAKDEIARAVEGQVKDMEKALARLRKG